MIWVFIGALLFAVLLGGYTLIVTTPMPSLAFGWWVLLVVAAASAAASYGFRTNSRVKWSGVSISVLSIVAFVVMTALNRNTTTPTPGTPPPAVSTSPAAPVTAPAPDPAPSVTPMTAASLWTDANQWLVGQGLPDAATLFIILVAVGAVLFGIYAVAWKGDGKWPKRIGGMAVALALIYSVAIWLMGKERTDAAIAHIGQSVPLPGGPGASDGTASLRMPPALNASARVMGWAEATTIAFTPLPRERGCLYWTVDTPTFDAIKSRLPGDPRSHFGWEPRHGGTGPKPSPQLVAAMAGRSSVSAFVQTRPCPSR